MPTLQAAYAEAAKAAITNVASNYQQLFKQFQTQVLPKLRTQQALTDADLALSEKLKKESDGIQASADFEQLKSAAGQVLSAMTKFATQLSHTSASIAEDAPVATRAAFYAPMPPPPPDNFPIVKNVGKGGANDPKDVRTVQKLLNQRGIKTPILAPLASLDAAGLKELIGAIEHLQKNVLKLPIKSIDSIIAKNGVSWLFLETGLIAADATEAAKLKQFSQNLDTAKKLYGAYITEASQLFGIPEMEIYSTMGAEVAENIADPTIANAGGASGLMQVTSGTWEGILAPVGTETTKNHEKRFLKLFVNPQTGEANWERFQSWKNFASSKSDPQANIFVGTAVLKEKKMGVPNIHPDIKKSIITTHVAYNAGQSAVNSMIRLAGSNDPDVFLEKENCIKGLLEHYAENKVEGKFNEIQKYLPKAEIFEKIYTAKKAAETTISNEIASNFIPENLNNPPPPITNNPLPPKIEIPKMDFPKPNPALTIQYGIQLISSDAPLASSGLEAMNWNVTAQKLGKKRIDGTFNGQHVLWIGYWDTLQAAENEYPAIQSKFPKAQLIKVQNGKMIK